MTRHPGEPLSSFDLTLKERLKKVKTHYLYNFIGHFGQLVPRKADKK